MTIPEQNREKELTMDSKWEEIKGRKKLLCSDTVGFTIKEVVKDIFKLKTKNGEEYKDGYFNYGRSSFEVSPNGTIWFPYFTHHKEWINDISSDGTIISERYIGDVKKEEFKKLKPEDPHREDRRNRDIYVFAKDDDGFYRFKGVFKFIKNENLVFIYKKISCELNINE